MKEKFLTLTWPQRVMLLLQVFLVILFLILYLTLGRQQMIKYDGTRLLCQTKGDTVTYSGKLHSQKIEFTVSPGPVVEYRVDDTLHGPYTITEDPTAVPDTLPVYITSPDALVGVEVREGSHVLFRGAVLPTNFFRVLSEDGSTLSTEYEFGELEPGSGIYGYYRTGPDIETILRVALKPDLTRRGEWFGFWLGAFCCAMVVVSVLFADGLFRWHLRFRIHDVENAEPSDWEIFSRWCGWIVITIMALAIFIFGLNAPTL